MRTQQEIDEQIVWLKANRDKVAARNFFGESNRDKIDAEIEVLEQKLTESECWDKTAEEGEDAEDVGKEWSWEVGESARDAAEWLAGDADESPKDNWEPLVK